MTVLRCIEEPILVRIIFDVISAQNYFKRWQFGDAENHTGEKFSCDQCTQSFSECGSLKVHRRKHTGAELLSCDQCTKYLFMLEF